MSDTFEPGVAVALNSRVRRIIFSNDANNPGVMTGPGPAPLAPVPERIP